MGAWKNGERRNPATDRKQKQAYYTETLEQDVYKRQALSTPSAGGPYTITFVDGKLTEIRDILMGELWLCSGQSNMEMPMKGFKNQPVENKGVITSAKKRL